MEPIIFDATPVTPDAPTEPVEVSSDDSAPELGAFELLPFARELGVIDILGDTSSFAEDKESQGKIKFIVEHLKSEASTPEEMLLELKTLKNKLGRVPIGKTPLSHVYQYIYLLRQSQEIAKEINNYGG